MTTAALYLRISEDKTGESLGVERQERECRELAARLGFEVGAVFVDNDVSATSGRVRPSFERLLKERPSVVLVWHTDRLVRVSKDLERVLDLGLTVHAVTAGHVDLSTPAGRAVARTVTAWSTYEGEQKALRQRAAARQRADSGKPWWSARPFGYEMDGTLREDEAQALREAYAGILAGASLARVTRDLNGQGFATTRGNKWRAESLRPVLMNARNAAIRTYDGKEVGPGGWAAVVDERTWRSVVRLLDAPERKSGSLGHRAGLLSGFANCGKCGGAIRLGWRGKKGKPGSYDAYTCRGKHCVTMRRNLVDDHVLDTLSVLLTLPVPTMQRLWVRPSEDGEDVDGELRQVEQELAEWAEDRLAGRVTRAQMLRATEVLEARQKALRDRMEASTGLPDELSVPTAAEALSVLEAMETGRARQTVQKVFGSIALLPIGRGKRTWTYDRVVMTTHGEPPMVIADRFPDHLRATIHETPAASQGI